MGKSDELHRALGANIDESMGSTRGPAAAVTPRSLPPRLQGVQRLNNVAEIDLDRIIADPLQPRTEFDEAELQQLADSLRARGQLQPIRVRWDEGQGAHVVVVGERRWRAARLAGLARLACVVLHGEVSPEDLLEDQLVENCVRADLKPIEQARAYERLMKARGLSQRDLAEKLHVSPASVARAVRLLELPESVQEAVDAGVVPANTAYQISKVASPQAQLALAQAAVEEGLTREEVAQAVKAVQARRPVAAAKPEPTTLDLGDFTVKLTWRKGGISPLQALRRAVKHLQAQERGQEEGEAA